MGLFKDREESGTLLMIGMGKQELRLKFKPDSFNFDIKDDPTDPGPLSCNPVALDHVNVSFEKIKGKHYLVVEYQVFGVKHLVWSIKG